MAILQYLTLGQVDLKNMNRRGSKLCRKQHLFKDYRIACEGIQNLQEFRDAVNDANIHPLGPHPHLQCESVLSEMI